MPLRSTILYIRKTPKARFSGVSKAAKAAFCLNIQTGENTDETCGSCIYCIIDSFCGIVVASAGKVMFPYMHTLYDDQIFSFTSR